MATNEDKFKSRFEGKIKEKVTFGERTSKTAYISVDGHFIEDGILYLLEIDSGNEAKLLAGQYALICSLFDKMNDESLKKEYPIEKCKFIVVHYYEGYNPKRTEKNLEVIKTNLDSKLAYKAIYEKDAKDWAEFLKLIK